MTELTGKSFGNTVNRSDDFEINLKDIVDLIKHSYKLIAIITFVFLIFGIYYAETRPPAYLSTAMIEVNNGALNALGSNGGMNALSGLMSMQSSTADVETVLLKSPYILGQVVQELNLAISVSPHYSGFFNREFARFRSAPGNITLSNLTVPNELLAKPLILVVKDANHYALLTQDGKKILDGVVGQIASATYYSKPVQILVTALNAKAGAQFDVVKQPVTDVANSVANALSILEESTGTGILKLNYVSGNREQAQKLLNTILSIAVTKDLQDKSAEAKKTLQFISDQLPASKKEMAEAIKKLSDYGVKSGVFNVKTQGPYIESVIDQLNQSLQKLKFQKLILLQKFTRDHPYVLAITQKENEVRKQIARNQSILNSLPRIGQREISLAANAKIQSSIYTALVESAQSMEMAKASTVSNVHILNSASYPVSRIPVRKKAIVFGSILLGAMISLAIIFIRHVLSPVIEDPNVVERALGISVMAIVPCSEKQKTHNKKIKYDKLYANSASFLLAHKDPNDISIEGMRSLRTAIQMLLLDAKNNVIAITGCSPGVGKSFVSSNLAALFSDLGKRIVVVDSDIRLGKMCQSFGKPKTPGLSTFLQNEAAVDDIIQNIIPGKLDFIATGLYPEKPSELFHLPLFAELIETLKSRYDLVLIDTPPILAVTDPALILRNSAINLLVLGVGKDQLKEVLHAKSMLEKGGVTLSGVIFNTLKHQKAGFGHNYGYTSYHYEYGQNK